MCSVLSWYRVAWRVEVAWMILKVLFETHDLIYIYDILTQHDLKRYRSNDYDLSLP